MAETLSYDNTPDTSVLSEEEQNSLEVGQALREEQDQLLAGKYKSAADLEKAYVELQAKLNRVLGLEGAAPTSTAADTPVMEEAPAPVAPREAAAAPAPAAPAPEVASDDDDDESLEFFKKLAQD